jgi:hypothetical protein
VFTARYGVSPYITRIGFVAKLLCVFHIVAFLLSHCLLVQYQHDENDLAKFGAPCYNQFIPYMFYMLVRSYVLEYLKEYTLLYLL